MVRPFTVGSDHASRIGAGLGDDARGRRYSARANGLPCSRRPSGAARGALLRRAGTRAVDNSISSCAVAPSVARGYRGMLLALDAWAWVRHRAPLSSLRPRRRWRCSKRGARRLRRGAPWCRMLTVSLKIAHYNVRR